MKNILSLKDISYSYNSNKSVLEDVNIDFKKGKFYTIVGPSGSGKTTLISLACGLDAPSSGEIFYMEESLKNISLEKYRNKFVSIIFQGYNLLNYLSAIENITAAMNIKGIKTSNNKEFAIDMLNRVGITKEQGMQKTLTLSGGQQQRVAIARALCCDSDLIIADEPTGNLDEETSKEIISLFKDIVETENKTVIMVTHDTKIASMSDETFLVKEKSVNKLFYK